VAFTSSLHPADLEACAVLAETWHRQGLATPLLLTPDEFRRSIDCFPLEYQAILDAHVVIAGRPPFDGVRANPDDLRAACESQAKGHLIHLRQAWLEAHGHRAQLATKLVASAAPLRALLMHVAHLSGASPQTDADLATFAATPAGMPRDLVEKILALEATPASASALVGRIGEYVAAAEQLWAFVDTWHA
jgi:hypothetical protein